MTLRTAALAVLAAGGLVTALVFLGRGGRETLEPTGSAAHPGGPGAAEGSAPSRDAAPSRSLSGPSGILRGRVLDPEGRGVAGIGIEAGTGPDRARLHATRSRPGGDFAMTLPAGPARVRASSRSWLVGPAHEVVIPPHRSATVELTLHREATAVIRLTAPRGLSPGPGVLRLVHSRTGSAFSRAPDPGGLVELAGLPRGEYRVEPGMEGLVAGPETARTLLVEEARPRFELRLARASRILGLVRDGSRAPVAGARVVARIRGATHASVLTDARGAYLLEVGPGVGALSVEHAAFAPSWALGVTAVEGGSVTVDVVLEEGATLTGTVRTKGGQAVAGAAVTAQRVGPTPDLAHVYETVFADGSGRFTVLHVGAGDHAVRAEGPGLAAAVQRVSIVQGADPGAIAIALGGGATLEGQVVDSGGAALAGAEVRLQGDAEGRAVTGADGAFAIRGLSGAPVGAWVHAAAYLPAYLEGLVPGGGPVRATLLRAAAIRGTVVFEGAGQEGVECLAAGSDGVIHRAFTAADGSFRIEGMPPGRVRIEARAPGFAGSWGPENLAEGAVADVTIRLGPAGE